MSARPSTVTAPRVLATLCARGGSKGLPSKNLQSVGGHSLLGLAVACARACSAVTDVVVSTDSPSIAEAAVAEGIDDPIMRPADLASDTAPKAAAIAHAATEAERRLGVVFDYVVDLDVGTPLRVPADIEGTLRVLQADASLDAAVTVYEAERNPYFNMVEVEDGRAQLVKRPERPAVRRQDAPAVFSVTPSVFAWKRDRLDVTHLYEGRWGVFVVPRERAVDIDTPTDLALAEALWQTRAKRGDA